MIAGECVIWSSKLQPTVALSSSEAEYMAASAAVQEAMFLRCLLASLGFAQSDPTVIFEDNQGCIALSENPVLHQRTKHIDIRHHYVRECVASGDVVLQYVSTDRQVADLLTKALSKVKVEALRAIMMGHR